MKIGKPLIINLACTGVLPTRAMNPHVPLSHDEIINDVARCLELGVQIIHLHARDANGVHTSNPEPYGRLIEAIRKLPGGRESLLCVTTSGRKDPHPEARMRVLDLDGNMKPDMASLTPGSLNFRQSVGLNPPDTIRRIAARMQERGIRPELEVFDLGMANFARVLLKEGLITPPLYVNVILGNVASAQVDALQFSAILATLPGDCIVSVGGIGSGQLAANGLGLLFADGVRCGLEDNLWQDATRTQPASNEALIRRILRLAQEFERTPMPRPALQKLFGGNYYGQPS